MTRYTKLEGRKPAAAKSSTSLFDEVHAKKRPATAQDGGNDDDDPPDQDKDNPSKRQRTENPSSSNAPPAPKLLLTTEAKLKRVKLLKLKAKKAKNEDKRKTLLREMAQLERQVTSEGGEVGLAAYQQRKLERRQGGKGQSGKVDASGQDNDQGVKPNPWKVMEAERRAKTEARSSARREKRIAERQASLTCFACRATGHSAKDCPNALNANVDEDADGHAGGAASSSSGPASGTKGKDVVGICFKCGSTAHTLSRCPSRRRQRRRTTEGTSDADSNEDEDERETETEDLPYATCFVCSQRGHLASTCPQNAHRGVFPRGGAACAVCKSVRHRARDCPVAKLDGEEEKSGAVVAGLLEDESGGAVPAAAVVRRSKAKTPANTAAQAAARGPPRKVVTF